MKKRSKEANKRKQAKKERKARARKEKKKRSGYFVDKDSGKQCYRAEDGTTIQSVDIDSLEKWLSLAKDGSKWEYPVVIPVDDPQVKEFFLGKQGSTGAIAKMMESRLQFILGSFITGGSEFDGDNFAFALSFHSSDYLGVSESETLSAVMDARMEATSMFSLPLRELYEAETFGFHSLPVFAETIEETIRDSLALQSENAEKNFTFITILPLAIKGSLEESGIWQEMIDGADNVRQKPFIIPGR